MEISYVVDMTLLEAIRLLIISPSAMGRLPHYEIFSWCWKVPFKLLGNKSQQLYSTIDSAWYIIDLPGKICPPLQQ